MFGWNFHYRLYLSLGLGLVLPVWILQWGQWIQVPGLPLAFIAILVLIKLLMPSEKQYLPQARKLALQWLTSKNGRPPTRGEAEVLALKMVETRTMSFFVIGGLLCLSFLIS